MNGIKTIINMVNRNWSMATIDLKDTCYNVSISRIFQKFLKFKWKDKLYVLHVFQMVMGLGQETSLN